MVAEKVMTWPGLFTKVRREGDEMREKTVWRGPEGAQVCLTARRARGRSTSGVFAAIGDRSRQFMNNAG